MNNSVISSHVTRPEELPGPRFSRNTVIALGVVLLHVGFIWALQSGLLMRAAELLVPVEVLSQFIEPPVPKVDPPPPLPPAPVVQKKMITKAPVLPPPQPLAIVDPAPSPAAPTGAITPPVQVAPASVVVAPAASPTSSTSPAAAVVQLPSSDADYLQNPRPPYPPLSKRMGEQGKVIVRVLIGVDGQAQKSEIRQSSGFERLDQVALTTVMRWRYVPGKRGGVAEAMWFNVPINFVLE